jgi:predicted nucleic acid-binding protein
LHKREDHLVELLRTIDCVKIEIDWNEISRIQLINVQNGLNKIGIPDLIILQNCIHHNLGLFSLDKHFKLMEKLHGLSLIIPEQNY